ncbi:aldolase [Deinococcus irradiatisoli]|uniref:3-oxo-tetronate 4-phosphate decarboxylase n=1 Tax=Deinococcus irradiatisoli TaxID=2202254 RepID=A0A2Z3JKC7_9DEIO|nr:3-oxo-tetronate 4-phosphate decarboxylase [Deinococcus irradiatisoli]AWN24326.1 aldolase [Deinococcus irradiatisoli]
MTPASQAALREALVAAGRSLFERGLSPGSSGNLSVRLPGGQGFLLTPTNVSLGQLQPQRLSWLSAEGEPLDGDAPTKEAFLHLALYRARPQASAAVHLHSTASAAVSCLDGLDADACLPPLTPYFVMKIGALPLIAYHRPGDPALAAEIARLAPGHPAVLLANHGPVVSGKDLGAALSAAEELEETAKLFLLLRGQNVRMLTPAQIQDLEDVFGRP